MLRSIKMAAAAAGLILASTFDARAADVATIDDTARFLAGMPPSEGSPLAALTKDPAWQHHARFFDNAFGQLREFLKQQLDFVCELGTLPIGECLSFHAHRGVSVFLDLTELQSEMFLIRAPQRMIAPDEFSSTLDGLARNEALETLNTPTHAVPSLVDRYVIA